MASNTFQDGKHLTEVPYITRMTTLFLVFLIGCGVSPTAETTIPPSTAWLPRITTDCETWTIRQSAAAREELWPHVDYMTINDVGPWLSWHSAILPRTPGSAEFVFEYWSGDELVHRQEMIVEAVAQC